MTAEMRPVPGFPDYAVTADGRVLSVRPWRGTEHRELRGRLDTSGYRQVVLCPGDGRRIARSVHTLVAEAFHGPRPPGAEVRHLDGDSTNNRLENLRYGSPSENQQDALRHGTHANARKTHCAQGHAYDAANTYHRPGAGRSCRTCLRERARKYRKSDPKGSRGLHPDYSWIRQRPIGKS